MASGWRASVPASAPPARARMMIVPMSAALARSSEPAIVEARRALGHRPAGAGVERVVDDLDGVERLRIDRLQDRRRLADAAEADEARLAGLLQLLQRRDDLVQRDLDIHAVVGVLGDQRIVQLEEIDVIACRGASGSRPSTARRTRRSASGRPPSAGTWCRARRRASAP